MKMQLYFEVHDNDGIVHHEFKIDLESPHTLARLKNELFSTRAIHQKYHRLFTKSGKELVGCGETILQSLELEHGSKVIFKHTHLPLWDEYKECVDLVLNKQLDKITNAKKADKLLDKLIDSGFLRTYRLFNTDDHYEVKCQFDEKIQMNRKATEDYFRNLHDQKRGTEESEFICHFNKRRAFVRIHGEDSVTEYMVTNCYRNHHRGIETRLDPDFTELYCYKLLSLIGVCPKTHIIPPSCFSGTKTNTYIAIQKDYKFEWLKNEGEEKNLCADVIVQLSMLEVLLHVYIQLYQRGGKWKGTKNAAIADFAPNGNNYPPIHSNIKQKILEQIRNWRGYEEDHNDDYLLYLAKVYFDRWDLPSKIELAREQLNPIDVFSENFESLTEKLNVYIDKLKKNVENLQTVLNSIVL